MGLIVTVATVFWASLLGVDEVQGLGTIVLSMAVFVIGFEHLLPLLIVRNDPERVLDLLLPSFGLIARVLQPITRAWSASSRRCGGSAVDRSRGRGGRRRGRRRGRAHLSRGRRARGAHRAGGPRAAAVDRRLRRHARARGDDAAARHRRDPVEATLGEVRALLAEQQYSRVPVFQESLDHIVGFVYVKDLIRRRRRVPRRARRVPPAAAGALRARDQAGGGAAEGIPAPAGAVGGRRRRIRRHRGAGHDRGSARGDRRRNPRRVRRRVGVHRR